MLGVRRITPLVLVALMAAGTSMPAWALYKVVGPDGKVTYTDRPPTGEYAPSRSGQDGRAPIAGLPYELQQAASRHPVTLYTSDNCGACDEGRALLTQRGVPFTERTVNTPNDVQAFQAQESLTRLPLLKIGAKRLIGLQRTDWNAYLDAAGYPEQSRLPSGYRQPAASPLAPASASSAEGRSSPETSPSPAAPVVPPKGIRF